MDREFVFYFLFISITAVLVDALRRNHYELNTAGVERGLKYAQIIEKIREKEMGNSDWDSRMQSTLNAKYRDMFYAAYNDHKGTPEQERIKQLLLQYLYKKHPNMSKELLQEISMLQTPRTVKPTDWRQVMSRTEDGVKIIEDNLLDKDYVITLRLPKQEQQMHR